MLFTCLQKLNMAMPPCRHSSAAGRGKVWKGKAKARKTQVAGKGKTVHAWLVSCSATSRPSHPHFRYKGLKTYWSSSWLHCLVIYLIRNICREENSDKQYYIINNLLYEVAMGCLCHAPHGTGCMRTCSIHSLYEKDLLYVGWVNIYMMCRLCLICQWSIDGKASTNGGKGLCWLTYDRVAHVQEDNLCNQNLKYLLVSTHQLTLYVDRALEALHNLSTALTCCMHRPL